MYADKMTWFGIVRSILSMGEAFMTFPQDSIGNPKESLGIYGESLGIDVQYHCCANKTILKALDPKKDQERAVGAPARKPGCGAFPRKGEE